MEYFTLDLVPGPLNISMGPGKYLPVPNIPVTYPTGGQHVLMQDFLIVEIHWASWVEILTILTCSLATKTNVAMTNVANPENVGDRIQSSVKTSGRLYKVGQKIHQKTIYIMH